MHIILLFSTNIPACDGIANHVKGIAKRLRARGHKITLITRGNWLAKEEIEYEGLKVIKVPFHPIYPFHVHLHKIFVSRKLKTIIPQPDLIHLHSPLVPALPKKWPIVTTFHTPMLIDTSYVEDIGLKTFLIKLMGKTTSFWMEKKLLDISDAVIAVSNGVANELREFYGYKKYTKPIINVVDTEFFKPAVNRFNEEKQLLYIGRLAYRKGLFEIINSARYVVNNYPNVKYIIVGSGPLEKKLNAEIRKLNLNSNFEFYGTIHDSNRILSLYQKAYAILIPSYYESGPITLLEAMSCGKAIITTCTGLAADLVKNGENAILVKPKSAEELTEAIIKLISSKNLCENLGEAARKTVIEKINIEKNTDEIEEVYRNAIEKFNKEKGC